MRGARRLISSRWAAESCCSVLDGPVHEAYRAVMPQHEVTGDVADGRPAIAVVSAHGEQELVLGRGQPGLLRLLLAPMQETAQPGAELQKPPVFGVFQIAVHGFSVAQGYGVLR
jgi:hypothetical protein